MDKSVRRVTVVQLDGENKGAEAIYKKGGKKRKSSKALSPIEKVARRILKTHKVLATELLDRHEKESRKRKDGWLRKMPVIQMKSSRKALKTLLDE